MGYPTDDDFRDSRFYAPPPGARKKPLPVKVLKKDNGHTWGTFRGHQLPVCVKCWLVKRADGTSKPCKGAATITTRANGLRETLAQGRLNADVKKSKALAVIAQLYVAAQRKGWEKGPTLAEAFKAAQDYYYQEFGYDNGAASEELIKIGGGVVKEIGS